MSRAWRDVDEAAMVQIASLAASLGIAQVDLARVAGSTPVVICRWKQRRAHLSDEQIAKLRRYLAAQAPEKLALAAAPLPERMPQPQPVRQSLAPAAPAPAAVGGGPGASVGVAPVQVPQEVRKALAVLEALAGNYEPPPLAKGACQSAHALSTAAIGSLVRVMISGKDNAKIAAAREILERGLGKAVQPTLDLTEKPPATDEQLKAALAKLMKRKPRGGGDGKVEATSGGDGNHTGGEAAAGAERVDGEADRVGGDLEPEGGGEEPEATQH